MIPYALPDEATIAANGLPWHFLDYALQRDVLPTAIARNTGMPGDGSQPLQGALISPQQCLQLLTNALREIDSPDTSFMLGQHLLPGADAALSAALRHSASLQQALEILCRWPARLLPLLRPRLHVADGQMVLYWTDSHGAPGVRAALVEMHMTAVVSLARWLGGARLPWRFCFNRARPRHIEQHEVHLGGELRFDCQLDAMLLDATLLSQHWANVNGDVCAASVDAANQEGGTAPSLVDALYDYLLAEVRCSPTLERASAAFGVSPATMKRHLARYGTHFVAELDQVRTHVALYLFQSRRADNEAVADYLGFHDAANFRRSFKRWTGLTPALLRASLAG